MHSPDRVEGRARVTGAWGGVAGWGGAVGECGGQPRGQNRASVVEGWGFGGWPGPTSLACDCQVQGQRLRQG